MHTVSNIGVVIHFNIEKTNNWDRHYCGTQQIRKCEPILSPRIRLEGIHEKGDLRLVTKLFCPSTYFTAYGSFNYVIKNFDKNIPSIVLGRKYSYMDLQANVIFQIEPFYSI